MQVAYRLLSVLLGASIAAAQQPPGTLPGDATAETVEPVRRYSVELIIFRYSESVSAGNEVWLPEEPAEENPRKSTRHRYFGDADDQLAEIEAPAVGRRYMDLELEMFREGDYTMTSIFDKLAELDAYQPILMAGWTQPTYAREVTASIPLDRLAQSPPWLDGELTLYLGRYLHLVVDLRMSDHRSTLPGEAAGASPATMSIGDARNDYGEIDAFGRIRAPAVRYRIFEDRILKNGDIRYFDHPKFGVIAKVTRFEEPDADDEIVDDTDDLLPAS